MSPRPSVTLSLTKISTEKVDFFGNLKSSGSWNISSLISFGAPADERTHTITAILSSPLKMRK